MIDPKKPPTDPNEVVKDDDGEEIRPGRYVDDGEGMEIIDPEDVDNMDEDED